MMSMFFCVQCISVQEGQESEKSVHFGDHLLEPSTRRGAERSRTLSMMDYVDHVDLFIDYI